MEQVTVDDAAWATLHLASGAVASLEVSRFATGRKNALQIEVYGSRGGLAFDLERLNELRYFDAKPRTGAGVFADPRHRAVPPLRGQVVASRAYPRLGLNFHQPGRGLPFRDRRWDGAVAVI
jgi:predicted dehydrogenase